MPIVVEGSVPSQMAMGRPWTPTSPYNAVKYCPAPTSSPAPMSPVPLPCYLPHLQDSPLPPPPPELTSVPSSGWYGDSVPASGGPTDPSFPPYGYDGPYVTPQNSITFSPPTEFADKAGSVSVSQPAPPTLATFSPVSDYSRLSEPCPGEYVRPVDESFPDLPRSSADVAGYLSADCKVPPRPRSSPGAFQPNGMPWSSNPLGISTSLGPEPMFASGAFPPLRTRSPRLSEPAMELPSDLAAPTPRRLYAPIAPHPMVYQVTPRSNNNGKRSRDDDEAGEGTKKRKRSDSNTTVTMELGEEDKLLIRLKDEESMPWKDIAARFQSDLGKTYQIPALQMRLKRLRERMRVWTEADVRALRMAHEYWVQSKFDIIAQKMLEFGAAEKWTSRQCARKWAEIDPGPTPYTTYDHVAPPSYAPYSMSPVDAQPPPFMPFLQIP